MDEGVYEFENRSYTDPNAGVNEANQFIDNFRQTQTEHTNQIENETKNLGSDLPASEGGLAGSTELWTSRYQTAPNEALVADLKATTQAKAMADALDNIKEQWRTRYNIAYRNYYRRKEDEYRAKKAAAAKKNSSNTNTNNNNNSTPAGNVTTESTNDSPKSYSTAISLDYGDLPDDGGAGGNSFWDGKSQVYQSNNGRHWYWNVDDQTWYEY